MLLLCAGIPGCSGCSSEPPGNPKQQAARAQAKPDFEQLRLLTSPNDDVSLQDGIKPGHWTGIVVEDLANNFDFRGQLTLELLDQRGQPLDLTGTPYRVQTKRPVTLPKEQRRRLETTLFLPTSAVAKKPADELLGIETIPQFSAASRLSSDTSGLEFAAVRATVNAMPDFQFFFVVLAHEPENYRWLLKQPFIKDPCGQVFFDAASPRPEPQYRLIMPPPDKRPSLPAQALAWTPIAYLLWDDWQPGDLSPDQQQALLDWLHWGGQLIISGPRSLEGLRGSFLESYLPARAGKSIELPAGELRSIEAFGPPDPLALNGLKVSKPWSGIELIRAPEATYPKGLDPRNHLLMAERRVGKGRIVVTAFPLAQSELRQWPGCDGFFNGCLLGRAGRQFDQEDPFAGAHWADCPTDDKPDPKRASQLRYFTRDVATWDDNSPVSEVIRDSLRHAAGIEIPSKRFVVTVLVCYLIVLVPLNWLLFRALGRVELAWAAAPVIAVVCTGLVVWLAQLDIGFARAKTEIGVVELQPNYARAHVTRYTALYSSLGTNYRFDFDDPTAVALPFSAGKQPLAGQAHRTVVLERRRMAGAGDDDHAGLVSLEDFEASSNTTGMVHSEQMMDLGGAIELERIGASAFRVTNRTRLRLRDCLLVSGPSVAWFAQLDPGETQEVELTAMRSKLLKQFDYGPESAAGQRRQPIGIRLGPLMKEAARFLGAEIRLVAWTDEELPGVGITPHVAQSRVAQVIVAHLDYGPLPEPKHDDNLPPEPEPMLPDK